MLYMFSMCYKYVSNAIHISMLQACYFAFQKTMKLTNRDFYNRILFHLSRREVAAIGDPRTRDFLMKAFGDVVHESDISSVISKFLSAARSKWDAVSRHKDHFEQNILTGFPVSYMAILVMLAVLKHHLKRPRTKQRSGKHLS